MIYSYKVYMPSERSVNFYYKISADVKLILRPRRTRCRGLHVAGYRHKTDKFDSLSVLVNVYDCVHQHDMESRPTARIFLANYALT